MTTPAQEAPVPPSTGHERVTADEAADQACKDMRSVLQNQLHDAITRLNTAGTQLSDPNHWAGRHADDFRQNAWPKLKGDLQHLLDELTSVQRQVETELNKIFQAGDA